MDSASAGPGAAVSAVAPGAAATPRSLAVSLLVSGPPVAAYLLFIVWMSRRSLVFEAILSLGLPLACWATGRIGLHDRRVLTLVVIETYFNVVAIAAKLAHALGSPSLDRAASSGFAAYFAVQAAGFVITQRRRNKPWGALQTVLGVGLISLFFARARASGDVVDDQGRLLMWGREAPAPVLAVYAIWALGVLAADTEKMPYLRQLWVHLISIAVSLWSREFFHARLLTACHLLLLDLVVPYTTPEEPRSAHLCLPPRWHAWFEAHGRERLSIACALGVAAVFGVTVMR